MTKKKKSILDILEAEQTELIEVTAAPASDKDKVIVMDGNSTKRQTYCMTLKNLELIRQVSFFAEMSKQDVVNKAVENYIQTYFPDIFKKVVNFE